MKVRVNAQARSSRASLATRRSPRRRGERRADRPFRLFIAAVPWFALAISSLRQFLRVVRARQDDRRRGRNAGSPDRDRQPVVRPAGDGRAVRRAASTASSIGSSTSARRSASRRRIFHLVTSAAQRLAPLGNDELVGAPRRTSATFSRRRCAPACVRGGVVRERRATFSVAPGSRHARPPVATGIDRLCSPATGTTRACQVRSRAP